MDLTHTFGISNILYRNVWLQYAQRSCQHVLRYAEYNNKRQWMEKLFYNLSSIHLRGDISITFTNDTFISSRKNNGVLKKISLSFLDLIIMILSKMNIKILRRIIYN